METEVGRECEPSEVGEDLREFGSGYGSVGGQDGFEGSGNCGRQFGRPELPDLHRSRTSRSTAPSSEVTQLIEFYGLISLKFSFIYAYFENIFDLLAFSEFCVYVSVFSSLEVIN